MLKFKAYFFHRERFDQTIYAKDTLKYSHFQNLILCSMFSEIILNAFKWQYHNDFQWLTACLCCAYFDKNGVPDANVSIKMLSLVCLKANGIERNPRLRDLSSAGLQALKTWLDVVTFFRLQLTAKYTFLCLKANRKNLSICHVKMFWRRIT